MVRIVAQPDFPYINICYTARQHNNKYTDGKRNNIILLWPICLLLLWLWMALDVGGGEGERGEGDAMVVAVIEDFDWNKINKMLYSASVSIHTVKVKFIRLQTESINILSATAGGWACESTICIQIKLEFLVLQWYTICVYMDCFCCCHRCWTLMQRNLPLLLDDEYENSYGHYCISATCWQKTGR